MKRNPSGAVGALAYPEAMFFAGQFEGVREILGGLGEAGAAKALGRVIKRLERRARYLEATLPDEAKLAEVERMAEILNAVAGDGS
jgi:hypothetical protein